MFSKNKKEEAKKIAQQKIIDVFQEQLNETKSVADAGEKLMQLDALQRLIYNKIAGTKRDITIRATNRGGPVMLGGVVITLCAVATAATVTPFGVLLILPGGLSTALLAVKNAAIIQKNLLQKDGDFIGALESQQKAITEAANKVLNGPLENIVRSSRRDDVFQKYPDLQKRFAEAASKKFLENIQPPKPAGGKPEFRL